eukprot:TRINITY_DN3504_c0_g2_i4.p1 TRINITY_DN3504_c0_g2~~TRINITY_DN3504_c0_g2_i4.p1  ORF type:complete len:298 (-),score=58.57 TRINITY_DN3504_c0_g2_i4:35-928(-)
MKAKILVKTGIHKASHMYVEVPLEWSLTKLKVFAATQYPKHRDYLSPEKCHFIFAGKSLDDRETVGSIVPKDNLEEVYVFYLKHTALARRNETEPQNVKVLDYLDTDYLETISKYHVESSVGLNSTTNIEDAPFLSYLPLMSRDLCKQLTKKNDLFKSKRQVPPKPRPPIVWWDWRLAINIFLGYMLFSNFFPKYHVIIIVVMIILYFVLVYTRYDQEENLLDQLAQEQQENNENANGANRANVQPEIRYGVPSFHDRVFEIVFVFVMALLPSWSLKKYVLTPVSYTHLTLPTIYSV